MFESRRASASAFNAAQQRDRAGRRARRAGSPNTVRSSRPRRCRARATAGSRSAPTRSSSSVTAWPSATSAISIIRSLERWRTSSSIRPASGTCARSARRSGCRPSVAHGSRAARRRHQAATAASGGRRRTTRNCSRSTLTSRRGSGGRGRNGYSSPSTRSARPARATAVSPPARRPRRPPAARVPGGQPREPQARADTGPPTGTSPRATACRSLLRRREVRLGLLDAGEHGVGVLHQLLRRRGQPHVAAGARAASRRLLLERPRAAGRRRRAVAEALATAPIVPRAASSRSRRSGGGRAS